MNSFCVMKMVSVIAVSIYRDNLIFMTWRQGIHTVIYTE